MKNIFRNAVAIGALLTAGAANAQNPYLPLWEHIPDGEPYVFEDPDRPGHQRVYVYGSHDNLVTAYCGLDQVVWSAPLEDLTQWRYDGVCFESMLDANGQILNPVKNQEVTLPSGRTVKVGQGSGRGDLLYAPDIVEIVENGKKVYYFTPNVQNGGRQTLVAKGDRPDGPFRVCNWTQDGRSTQGCFGFDPAIFQDDDGRIYGYWGFKRSFAAELDPKTMSSPKPGTKIVEDMVSSHEQDGIFNFFEASSIRKVQGKYVFIYSRFTKQGEFGLGVSNNTLAYAYSDHPLGPWTYGGTIIDGRARGKDEQGKIIYTGYSSGNTHGSICEIDGKWWVFYHRHSGTDEYSRQAMVAPIDVKVTKDGKVLISEGEVTSEGFRTEGLNPLERTAAGWACHFTGPKPMTNNFPNFYPSGSYPKATHNDDSLLKSSFSHNMTHTYMTNNVDGSTIGYKYFDFSKTSKISNLSLDFHLLPLGVKGEIVIMLDSPYPSKGGIEIGRLALTGNEAQEAQHLSAALSGLKGKKGKHALYLLFRSDTKEQSLCDLYDFIFRN